MAYRVEYDNFYLTRSFDWDRDVVTLIFQTPEQVERELRWRKQRYGDSGSFTVTDLDTGKILQEHKGQNFFGFL